MSYKRRVCPNVTFKFLIVKGVLLLKIHKLSKEELWNDVNVLPLKILANRCFALLRENEFAHSKVAKFSPMKNLFLRMSIEILP